MSDDAPDPKSRPIDFARMAGSSIAGRDAAPWVTDFLNAACYRRPVGERAVDDLRLAFCVLTTAWHRKGAGSRLHITDLPAFHRAFGADRFSAASSARGTLSRDELLAGAERLLGPWFAGAYADDSRRGWGIAFETLAERDAYEPESRLRLARLGELTPESAPPAEQVWHTYAPVAVASADALVAALTRPETWPDYASEIGRFTSLRAGGLLGQTFEVEVAAGTDAGRPVFTRGYVTITALVTTADPRPLAEWVAALEVGLARYGADEPRAVPEGAKPLVGLDLTTHQGHFMGRGHNRLLVYATDAGTFVRAAGTWDPMPWHLEQAYRSAGKDAQAAFWGDGGVARLSMLHQLAEHVAASTPAVPG